MMAIILEGEDRWDRPVVLHPSCWVDHVVRRRPDFAGQEQSCVGTILAAPAFVRRDADFSDRECFYGPSPLSPPFDGLLVKVVVAYTMVGPARFRGTVVTVHLTSGPKLKEEPIWP